MNIGSFAAASGELVPAGSPSRPVDQVRRDLLRAAIMKGATDAQLDLLCAISGRYGLDPLLQHVVLIDGKPFVTHKGLMHLAHASRQFDGMETRFGADAGGAFAACTVYRKDMARPFTAQIYLSEYNKQRGAWLTHPRAMAAKTVESFCLRRAFDVSLVSQEEMGQDTPPGSQAPGQDTPPGSQAPGPAWKQAAQTFSAAVTALPREIRQALKAELTARFGHCELRRFSSGELWMLACEVRDRPAGASAPSHG